MNIIDCRVVQALTFKASLAWEEEKEKAIKMNEGRLRIWRRGGPRVYVSKEKHRD
jgi:hypothetical protein